MSNLQQGKCFVLTGPNGGGKSTAGPQIAAKLTADGHKTVYIYGPGVTPPATALASLVKSQETSPSSKFSQSLVWLAQHAESLEHIRETYLDQGVHVILDRGPETTWVYNINGILEDRELTAANAVITALYGANDGIPHSGMLTVDAMLVFDVPIETALVRMKQQSETDQFQDAAREEHERRRQTYLNAQFGQRTEVIDASQPIETVVTTCTSYITGILNAA